MGPRRARGIGGGGIVNAAPTSPQNGSGGAGGLNVGPLNFSAVQSEISDVTTGRVTLGLINLTILGMLAFYWWTRSSQGGA